MHSITRKLFVSQVVLLAMGCRSQTAVAATAEKGWVSLGYIARLYSMRLTVEGRNVSLKNKWNTLKFETNSRRAWLNQTMVWLHHPCRKQGGEWSIRAIDFKKGIDPALRAYAHVPSAVPKVVVLDPGHGGKDSGAVGPSKVYEKSVVLDISKRVRRHLEARGIVVRMTRTGDTFPTLTQRSAYAVSAGAGLFVSIHADGAANPTACGVESFVLAAAGCESSNHYGQGGDLSERTGNRFDAANAVLGYSLQSNLLKASKRKDRGLRRARFAVLSHAPCPAALVECGFVTNPTEEYLLNSSAYRESVARGIANGVLGYFTLVKRAHK